MEATPTPLARGVTPVIAGSGGGASGRRLLGDDAVGKRLLQVGDARVRDLGPHEVAPRLVTRSDISWLGKQSVRSIYRPEVRT